MQWMDVGLLLLIVGAFSKAFMYFKSSGNKGSCHGGCSGCSQQCSYRSDEHQKIS